MRSVSPVFVGAVIGLLAVLFLPSQYVHDKFDLYYFIIIFGGLGSFVGWLVGYCKNHPRMRSTPNFRPGPAVGDDAEAAKNHS